METVELVIVIKGMGNTVRWPNEPNNPDAKRDTTKWYEFHSNHGHHTPDCIALQLEVANLLKKRHLQDLLFDKGKNTLTLRDN